MLQVASHVIPIINSVLNSGLIDPTKNQYELCLLISTLAFAGQKDRQGVPYVQHGLRLSNNPLVKDNEIAKCLSLLHDVIEDSDLSSESLKSINVNDTLLRLLVHLTHNKEITYEEYINNIILQAKTIKNGEILLLVKMADIEDNSVITRNYTEVSITSQEKIVKRHLKYMNAYNKLRQAYNEIHNYH